MAGGILLQVRTRALNDDLADDFARWYPRTHQLSERVSLPDLPRFLPVSYSYNPAGCDGCGDGTWSRDPAEAARFTPQEWAELWTASPENRPLRPDGKPNRPITMFSLTIVPAYPGRLPSILPAGPDGRPPMGDTEFVAHVYELAAQDAKRPPAPRPAPPPPPAEPVNLADEMRAMGLL